MNSVDRFVSARFMSAEISPDMSAVGIIFRVGDDTIPVKISASDARRLLRHLIAATKAMLQRRPTRTVPEPAPRVRRYEVREAFPDAVLAAFETLVFGRLAFGLIPEQARALGIALQSAADHVYQRQADAQKH